MISTVVTEPEFTAEERMLLIAHQRTEALIGPHGFSMDEATDPASEYAFEANETPRIDWIARAIATARDAYYKQWDRPDAPVNRAGHIWYAKRR